MNFNDIFVVQSIQDNGSIFPYFMKIKVVSLQDAINNQLYLNVTYNANLNDLVSTVQGSFKLNPK